MLPTSTLMVLGLAQLALAVPAPSNSADSATSGAAVHALVARSGGFWDAGCRQCNLWYWTINCVCNGGWVSADLNPYITNDDGTLQWFNGGGYGGSCSGCNLQSETLGCNCKKINGDTNWGTINLNDHLSFGNGQLTVN